MGALSPAFSPVRNNLLIAIPSFRSLDAVATAAAGLDRDEIALLQHQVRLAVDRDVRALPDQRDAAGLAGFAALHAERRHHHALDAGGQMHRRRQDAIATNDAVPAAMGSRAAGLPANGLLLDLDRVIRLDHLDRRIRGIGQMHPRPRDAAPIMSRALATAVDLVELFPGPALSPLGEEEDARRGGPA